MEVLPVSSLTGEGLGAVRALVGPGRTAAMVGPSGVGKSSLANALAGETLAATREIREDGRGRHTTTARELQDLETRLDKRAQSEQRKQWRTVQKELRRRPPKRR